MDVFFYKTLNYLKVIADDTFLKLFFNIIIAMAGGLVQLILEGKETSYKHVLARLFVAAFVGLLVGRFCIAKEFPDWLTNMACATSGLSGDRLVYLIQGYILKILPFGPNPNIREKNDGNNS